LRTGGQKEVTKAQSEDSSLPRYLTLIFKQQFISVPPKLHAANFKLLNISEIFGFLNSHLSHSVPEIRQYLSHVPAHNV
jgi:hypothetical protein